LRDYYSEAGIPAQRDTVSGHLVDRVDPFTGKLQLHHVDLVVPGNGGLDIRIIRSYSSQNDNPGERTPWGSGWTMHFGRVLIVDPNKLCGGALWQTSVNDNPVLELPDGSRQILADSKTMGASQPLFTTASRWKADCVGGGTGLLVTSPEGTQHRMDRHGVSVGGMHSYYPTLITDRNGNTVSLGYQTNDNATTGPLLTTVNASDGRAVTFTYTDPTGPNVRLASISANGQTWTYSFTPTPNWQNYWNLTTVTRPGGTTWSYTYNGQLGTNVAGSYSLRTVTHPEGGPLVFDYRYVDFNADGPVRLTAVMKKTAGSATWNYGYSPSSASGTHDVTTVQAPNGTITYRHFGYNTVQSGDVWKIGLIHQKTIGSLQTESYTWTSQVISTENNVRVNQFVSRADTDFRAPLLASCAITRDGTAYTTTYTSFDSFGNPRSISESGNGTTKSTSATYFTNTTKWIVKQLEDETITVNGSPVGLILRDFDAANGDLRSESRFGVSTSYTYHSHGELWQKTDARGNVRTFTNYHRGTARNESHPEAVNISRSVDNAGNVSSETDGDQFTRNFSHDGLNRPTGIDYPRVGSADATIGYTATRQTTTRSSYQELRDFDGYGRVSRIERKDTSRGISLVKTLTYDGLGRKSFESDWNSTFGRQFDYDLLDRLTRVTHTADSSFQQFTHSANNSVAARNERGHVTTYRYRSFGDPDYRELMAIELPVAGANIALTRNGVGQTLTVTQGGIQRSFGYDTRYFLTSETHPDTGTTIFGRDPVGNMDSRRVGTSTTTFIWDNLNRLRWINYPDSTSVEHRYNKRSKLEWLSNPSATRQLAYDANGNLSQESLAVGAQSFPVTYGVDSLDHVNTITYPSGQVVTYTPDALGRPTQVAPFVTSVSHHPSGQVSGLTYANGITTQLTFHNRLWPQTFRINRSTVNHINSTLSYDPSGNLISVSDSADASYNMPLLQYDPIDRLTTANGAWGNGTFTYHATGDIETQTLGSAVALTYTYNTATRRLSSISGTRARTYSYDVYGNVASDSVFTYAFDHAPNLRTVNLGLPGETRYDYDGKNIRVKSERNGAALYFFQAVNGDMLLEFSPVGNTFKEYAWLAGKQVALRTLTSLAQTSVSPVTSAPNASEYGQNAAFSVSVAGSNPTGTVTFKRGPDAMGAAMLSGGVATLNTSALTPGVHYPITARYEGDSQNEFGLSAPPPLAHAVNKRTTTASLASSKNPAVSGTSVTFTSDVTGVSPTGNVEFRDGAAVLGTATLSGGRATLATSTLALGNHTVTAVYGGDTTNAGSTSSALVQRIRSAAQMQLLAKGDFDSDAKSDILWRNPSTGESYLYPMDGLAIKASEGHIRLVADLAWQVAGLGDFDGNGKADILWRNGTTGENYIYFMDGLTISTEGYTRTAADLNWQVAGTGDFDGDGKADILWRHAATGENYIYPMDGLTIKPTEGYIRTVADPDWKIAGIGDFDGDGKADIFWHHATTAETYMFPMDGLTIKPTEAYVRTVSTPLWHVKGVGDFDGDGKADLVWRHVSAGENYIWPMDGVAIKPNEGNIRTITDTNWHIVSVGDFDGDGKADILWRHATTGENYIYPMDGLTILPTEGYIRSVPDLNWTVVGK